MDRPDVVYTPEASNLAISSLIAHDDQSSKTALQATFTPRLGEPRCGLLRTDI